MGTVIRPMKTEDTQEVLEMMRTFYSSPAVYTSGSEEIFANDIRQCVAENPYLEGYVFDADGVLQGYAMAAKSFSTEFGKPCIWIEDLYIKEACRGLGLGSRFLRMLQETYPDAIFRLEVEEENEGAVRLYERNGFQVLPYMEMKK